MSRFRDSDESRQSTNVVLDIIDGRGWIAQHVRNNSLRQHCRLLGRTFRGPHPLTDPLRPAARLLLAHVCRASKLLVSTHPTEFPVIPVLIRLAAYHRHWIRCPQDWQPDPDATPRQQLDALARHLFARWSMPGWFGSAWLEKGELFYLERDWYCHVAAGGSLRTVPGMPPSVTQRALHLAAGAPDHLCVREALRWGQVKSLGGSDGILREVFASRMLRDLSGDSVWSRLMEKVIGAKEFDPRDFGLIADALVETIRNEGQTRAEALVVLPLADLLGHARRFWNSVVSAGADVLPEISEMDIHCRHVRADLSLLVSSRWARMPYVRDPAVSGGSAWHIVELTCQAQLIAESRAMRHCVSTYRRKCHGETSSIFSLRGIRQEDGKSVNERHLTIEVNRQSRRIVQVRGKHNRFGTLEEFRFLRKWAVESALKF